MPFYASGRFNLPKAAEFKYFFFVLEGELVLFQKIHFISTNFTSRIS